MNQKDNVIRPKIVRSGVNGGGCPDESALANGERSP